MWVLGITKSHNGAVALIHNGKIVSAIQAERISRIKRQSIDLKNDKILLSKCVKYCLNQAGITHADIQAVGISTPWMLVISKIRYYLITLVALQIITKEHITFLITLPIWNIYCIIIIYLQVLF